MTELITLVGPSNSGKSTYALNYVNDHPNTYIVSRDSEREALFGHYRQGSKEEEAIITQIVYIKVVHLLKSGCNVILDNCHLNMKYLSRTLEDYDNLANIRFELMPEHSLELLLERNRRREKVTGKYVPERVIKDHHRRYTDLKREFDEGTFPTYFGKKTL